MPRQATPPLPVVVIGAGLAGLTCTVELAEAGVEVVVLERSDAAGGRVRTDEVDGFLLDRGFQVMLTAYPEARRALDYNALDLRPFFPGALIRAGGRFRRLADPWRRPVAGVAGILSGAASPGDALRIARLRAHSRRCSLETIRRLPERPTAERLRRDGFSEAIVGRFFRPFFGGVFLDPDLATSDRQLEFVFRMFSSGDIAVPARGMGEIPRQLAARLPEGSIRLRASARAVDEGRVVLEDGTTIEAGAVVLAVDASEAVRLVELGAAARWRGVTCLYFAAASPPLREPVLVLDGEASGPVNNLCVLSEVSAAYAPAGQSLVSVTVLGLPATADDLLESEVRSQLRGWFGSTVDGWRHLRTYRIERALPDQSPPTPDGGAMPVRLRTGLYVCGDHRADGSINGAMASGRAAAAAILADLGAGAG